MSAENADNDISKKDYLSGSWYVRRKDAKSDYYYLKLEIFSAAEGRWEGKQTLLGTDDKHLKPHIGHRLSDMVFIQKPHKLQFESRGRELNVPGDFEEQGVLKVFVSDRPEFVGSGKHKGPKSSYSFRIEGRRMEITIVEEGESEKT